MSAGKYIRLLCTLCARRGTRARTHHHCGARPRAPEEKPKQKLPRSPFQCQASTVISTSHSWLPTMTKRGGNPWRERGREERRHDISMMQLPTCSQRHGHSAAHHETDNSEEGRGKGRPQHHQRVPCTLTAVRENRKTEELRRQ